MRCSDCGGTGTRYQWPVEVGDQQPGEEEPCETCDGTGEELPEGPFDEWGWLLWTEQESASECGDTQEALAQGTEPLREQPLAV
jgi:hypothetical protein